MRRGDILGIFLVFWGLSLSIYSYEVLGDIPLTALGAGAFVTGISLLSTVSKSPYREAFDLLLKAYADNISRVLEEFGASSRAVYLSNGSILVPLSGSPRKVPSKIQNSLIVGERGGYYLFIQSPISSEDLSPDVEASLYSVLVDNLGLCDSVMVSRNDEKIILKIRNSRASQVSARFSQVLGPLAAHLACSIVAASSRANYSLEDVREEKGDIIASLVMIDAEKGSSV
jgi:hypothetical protein